MKRARLVFSVVPWLVAARASLVPCAVDEHNWKVQGTNTQPANYLLKTVAAEVSVTQLEEFDQLVQVLTGRTGEHSIAHA